MCSNDQKMWPYKKDKSSKNQLQKARTCLLWVLLNYFWRLEGLLKEIDITTEQPLWPLAGTYFKMKLNLRGRQSCLKKPTFLSFLPPTMVKTFTIADSAPRQRCTNEQHSVNFIHLQDYFKSSAKKWAVQKG